MTKHRQDSMKHVPWASSQITRIASGYVLTDAFKPFLALYEQVQEQTATIHGRR